MTLYGYKGHMATEAVLTPRERDYCRPQLAKIAEGVDALEQVAPGLYVTTLTFILMGPDGDYHYEFTYTLGMTE